ncbi:MAG: YbhB/YbcL family Raf kinase inhibitor-like protein [Desulfosarcinaceae bacterium]|nr:YbhB/YbcL family Raf kinase inhibitor-like protein [Desulfosarcinaceae bacterium]
MKTPYLGVPLLIAMLLMPACTNDLKDAAPMTVDFKWQLMDRGADANPEIRLAGVPAGTARFFVGLVDLDNNGYDHGGGFVDNDGSGVIARGSIKGNYAGPDPPFETLNHTYEITVKAYDDAGKVIGIGKQAHRFSLRDFK